MPFGNDRARIAAVGLGGWGDVILRAIAECENLELVACYDINQDINESTAKKFSCKPRESFEEICSDDNVQCVSLATPNFLHREQVEMAAKAGKHCFVEKPIANTVADGKRIIEVCWENGVVLEIGHNMRRTAEFRELSRIVKSGDLGVVVGCSAEFSHAGGFNLDASKWRYYKEKCPAPPLLQLGVHALDVLISILGSVKNVSSFVRHSVMPGDNTDNTVTIMEFECGVLGFLGSRYVVPSLWHVNVYGTKGNVFVSHGKVVFQCGVTRKKRTIEVGKIDTHSEQLREFGECVLNGKHPETDGDCALHVVAVVEAAIKSSELEKVINIGDILE